MVASVAVCLSGELRAFDDPCTLQTVIDRVILPLSADVFACVSLRSETSHAERPRVDMLHSLLVRSVNQSLLAFNVTEYSPEDRPACPDAEGCQGLYRLSIGCGTFQGGWPQSRGLKCCADHALERGYDWIIRSRLDLIIPFVLHSLPTHFAFPTPNGVAVVAGWGNP